MRFRFGILGCVAALCAAAGCGDDGTAGPAAGSGGQAAGASGIAAGSGGTLAGSAAGISGASAGTGAGAAAGSSGSHAGAGASTGSGAGVSGAQPVAAGAGAGGAPAPSGGATLKAQIVAKNIAPEAQEHVCVVVDLGNETPVWVDRVAASLSGGSHHLIVDRQPSSAMLYSDAKTCAPTMAGDASRLIIAQQKETSIDLPSGVAFKLEAHQHLFLQLHYFNVDQTAHDITGTVTMSIADSSAGPPIEAKNLFTGSTSINIPAHGSSESKAFYQPKAASGTRRVFALTSHTHHLGVRQTIERVASADAPAVTPLHESLTWSEPPLTQLAPPLDFKGTDGLRLTCRYQNDGDEAVSFGVAAQQEMCFMWLYYYDVP